MPVREIGGFVRATADAVLNLKRQRTTKGGEELVVGLNVAREVKGGRVRIGVGERVRGRGRIRPHALARPSKRPTRICPRRHGTAWRCWTAQGIACSSTPRASTTRRLPATCSVGPQPPHRVAAPADRKEGEFVTFGEAQEREGKLLLALGTYEDGLRRFPQSFALQKAAGRLAVASRGTRRRRPGSRRPSSA